MPSTARQFAAVPLALSILLLVTALRIGVGASLPLFGDEAFYWQESRAPAWGYSDVPPLTPWLIHLGTGVLGHTEFAVRAPFLLLAVLLALAVGWWARSVGVARDAAGAVLLSLLLPVVAISGAMALPEMPLDLAVLVAAIGLVRGVARNRWRDWLLLAAGLVLGWLSHYRFAVFYLAGAVFMLGWAPGRALWRNPRFWAAQALGLLGLLPLLLFNLQNDWAALRFQFVERHPWSFHADALAEPLVQALVATPLLFLAAVVAAASAARQGDSRRLVLAAGSLGILGAFLLIGLFADSERTRLHWPVPALLLALPLVPELLRAWHARGGLARGCAFATVPLAALATLALFALVLGAAAPAGRDALARVAWMTDNARGWHEVGAWVREKLDRTPAPILIADNFMLAAEIDFALAARQPVHVLDHPLNAKHGRALQLALWQRDERALGASRWSSALLLVEESAQQEIDRPAFYRSLCRRFAGVQWRDELRLADGRMDVLAFNVAPADSGASGCALPPIAYLDTPTADAILQGASIPVAGWAMQEHGGIARVELLVDGARPAELEYGVAAPKVKAQWPGSTDPNHPHVGFRGTLTLSGLAPGPHTLALRVTDRHGRSRMQGERRFSYAP